MRRRQDSLFSEGDLSSLMFNLPQMVEQQVNKIEQDQFLATPEEDLVRHVTSSLTMEPLAIYEDRTTQRAQETRVDVSRDTTRSFLPHSSRTVAGVEVVINLPFTGDIRLWKISPNSVYLAPRPHGQVVGDGVQMVFAFPSDESPERAKRHVDENLQYIREALAAQRQILDQYHAQMPKTVLSVIAGRRGRLARNNGILQALNIPLHPRAGVPVIAPLQVNKRIVTPLPPPPQGGFKPEPGISDAVFENILTIIRHQGRTYEATPATFAKLNEEELRDVVLANLNSFFEGAATGETFRGAGKTDLRIEAEDRAAFVGECKVWKGGEQLLAAVDQLLGYLTWRDCKAAIILYNKHNKGFADIQAQIPAVMIRHPRFMKPADLPHAGEWRFILRSKDDDARLVHCHVFAFNLFAPSAQDSASQ